MATALECHDVERFSPGSGSSISSGEDDAPLAWWLFFDAKDVQLASLDELDCIGFVRAKESALALATERLTALEPELTARTAETLRRFVAHVAKEKAKFLVLNAGWEDSKAELVRRAKWFEVLKKKKLTAKDRDRFEALFDLWYDEDEDGEQRVDFDGLESLLGEVTRSNATLVVRDAMQVAPKAMATGAELLAPVYANPFDEAARLVCADQLIEANDPRGEFIKLQCTPNLNGRQRRRLDTLWQLLREVLVAPFGGARVLFERGFATEVSFDGRPDVLRVAAPWATVHTLTLKQRPEFLTLPCLSSVKRLITSPADVVALEQRGVSVHFESIAIDSATIDDAAWAALHSRQVFPKLVEVLTPKTFSVWLPPQALTLIRARAGLRLASGDLSPGALKDSEPLGLQLLTAEAQAAREHAWANPGKAQLAGPRWDALPRTLRHLVTLG